MDKQEPVAWLYDFDLGDELVKDWTTLDLKHLPETANNIRPLFTAPPSKPWVSLTDVEAGNLFKDTDWVNDDWGHLSYARAIEAKLKEKNT